jgi:hypothetical protein
MFHIVIFRRFMNPSMDRKCDKVMSMLCIFKCTLSGGCQWFMIKLSNVCPCALKFVKQKVGASGN